jgi:serine/threonine-protein kinase
LWWVAVGLVALLAVLIVTLILVNNDDDDDDVATTSTTTTVAASTTTGSAASSTTELETTTTEPPPTTAAPTTIPATVISSFSGPTTVQCNAPTDVELSWATENAQTVELSIDGTQAAALPPSGQDLFPFACDGSPHTYVLEASGAGGDTSRQLTINQEGTNA